MNIKKGTELWNRAKKIIPGGTQLLSKRPDQFLPSQWPSYYQKAKGIEVWDLDGNKFIDMSIMGVGACILGYADNDVNEAVRKAVDLGSISTLNCAEEVELAELLLELNPWAGMVRYAKTGGEAMAVAVRISRAYTGKEKIAFCGYHGWHDWYLAANLADDSNLDGHLLPGLQPKGVPRGLKGSALPFNYNCIEELEAIIEKNEIGTVVMEPIRNYEPQNDFLGQARKIVDEIGAVLIFDEITSGWRLNVGGAHSRYNVFPDISVYGKAMSNGFPMAAIVGKDNVMNAAQETFISSTYWTDRIGPAASISAIHKMYDNKVPDHLCRIGNSISQEWNKIANELDLRISTEGIPPLTHFSFEYEENQALHTLFTQEMLKRGYLASRSVYVSYCHDEECVETYMENLYTVFEIIKKAIDDNNIHNLLSGHISTPGFKRLT